MFRIIFIKKYYLRNLKFILEMKKILIGFTLFVCCCHLLVAQQDNGTAQLKFNQKNYEGSIQANLSTKPFKAGFSTLHGIRITNTEDMDIPSLFFGLNVGLQPWTDGQIIYYAFQPRIYFPTTNDTEYYFAIDLGANTGITRLKSGDLYADIKFYFTPMVGAMIQLSKSIDLDLALKLQMLERSYSEGGTQIPVLTFGAGIRF